MNEFALQQKEAKKNLAFFPQHFHKDINCALKDVDKKNLSKLSSRERSALYSLETHKDTSVELRTVKFSFNREYAKGPRFP